jgi:hypothetical protein
MSIINNDSKITVNNSKFIYNDSKNLTDNRYQLLYMTFVEAAYPPSSAAVSMCHPRRRRRV